jgi:hypothetical protein
VDENFKIIQAIVICISVLYAILKASQLYINESKLHQFISQYYGEKNIKLFDVSKLNSKEKIRYGVPVFIFIFYSYAIALNTGKVSYVRKVEIEDEKGVQMLKYIEMEISKNEIISFKEIDSYEI